MQAPLQPQQLEPVAGLFRLSRLVHEAARLDLASALRDGPRSAQALAAALGLHVSATSAFLEALAAWGVLARDEDGRYGLTAVSRRLLPGEPGAANRELISGWAGLDAVFESFAGIEHTLRTGECGLRQRAGRSFHERLAQDAEQASRYQEAMSSTRDGFAASVAALGNVDGLLVVDVGGGRGDLLDMLLERHPHARGLCLDLPHVVQGLAPRHGGRLRFIDSDAFDELPTGADVYITSTVLRCFDDESALTLLRSVRRAMSGRDARLVCFEMVMPGDRLDPWMALANVTAHVVYGGRDRTADEFVELLARAGFSCTRMLPVNGALHVIEGMPVS
jgi:hypothetical protein